MQPLPADMLYQEEKRKKQFVALGNKDTRQAKAVQQVNKERTFLFHTTYC